MPTDKVKIMRIIVAALPLVLLAILVTMFSSSVNNYIRCQSDNCGSLSKTENLSKILVPDDPNNYISVPGDTAETKKNKEIKNNRRNTLIYSGRIFWVFLKMVYVFTCILALAVGCFVIYSSFEQIKKYSIVAVSIALLLALALGVYLSKNSEVYQSLLIPLFELTIKQDTGATGNNDFGKLVRFFGLFDFNISELLCALSRGSFRYSRSFLKNEKLKIDSLCRHIHAYYWGFPYPIYVSLGCHLYCSGHGNN